jgi:hypothetical protein
MKNNVIADRVKKAAGIFSIFHIPRLPQHGEQQKMRFRKEAVMQTSNGNVLLQLGHYITEEKIQRMKKDLAL